jgi:hypothetical protein
VSSIAQLNTFNVTLEGISLHVTENFISPTDAGISINGTPYTLYLSSPVTIGTGATAYSVDLTNISYLPLQQTINLLMCPTGVNSTTAPATTVPPTTTVPATPLAQPNATTIPITSIPPIAPTTIVTTIPSAGSQPLTVQVILALLGIIIVITIIYYISRRRK